MNDNKETRKKEIHKQNRITLVRELRLMSRAEEPYQCFANAPPITLGILHLAAHYLESEYP